MCKCCLILTVATFGSKIVKKETQFRFVTQMFFNFQLASMRGRYRTMRDEADNTVQNNGFIMGFSNPLTESVADKTDGSVTVLGYRSLGEDSNKDGVKGKAVMKDRHFAVVGCV